MSGHNNFNFAENKNQDNVLYYRPELQSLARVNVNLSALRDNFLFLKQQSQAEMMPVIKADAYGHGLIPCAQVLEQAGARIFAVGTVGEGVLLRQAGIGAPIVALLGALDEQDCRVAVQYSITPFVPTFEQLRVLQHVAGADQASFVLKFDTGMRRLGFSENELGVLLEVLNRTPNLQPFMAASHLAVADETTGGNYTQEQMACFSRIITGLRQSFPAIKSSLLNSAGILAYGDYQSDVARPGIALYGVNPLLGTNLDRPEIDLHLKPVMQVIAPVIQVHALKKGQSISYGRTFTAPEDMTVAIVGAGYAQGYSRGLSSKGVMLIKGKRCPVLGRVCMQLVAVDVSSNKNVQEGDWAYLLGGENEQAITVHELAQLWGTISYEVFCILGTMNTRKYSI